MILIKLLNIIAIALENNMETDDNTQLCENEEIIDESIDKNKKQNILKKEPENVIEFYDIYP